jgi:hypothetical protein
MGNAKAVTEKEYKGINQLVSKALDKELDALNTEEVKELQGLLKKMDAERKAKREQEVMESLSEVIDRNIVISLAEKALEVDSQKRFDQLPTQEKFNSLKSQISEIANSASRKQIEKELIQKEEEEAFNVFYEEYANKFGNSL